MQWTIDDGLGLIPKDGLETCHHNFDLPQWGWLPRGKILNGNWEDGDVSPGEPQTRDLQFGSADRAIATPSPLFLDVIKV